jgi:hypothetical protein
MLNQRPKVRKAFGAPACNSNKQRQRTIRSDKEQYAMDKPAAVIWGD